VPAESKPDHATALVVLLVLGAIAWAIFLPALEILPLRGENLHALAWVDQAPAGALLAVDQEIYPEWRPLAYFTLWLEHRVIQLQWPAAHHVSNLLIWVVCAWLVFLIARELTRSTPLALFAAVVLLVDHRSIYAMTWLIERQTTLACGFGLAAILLAIRASRRPPTAVTTWQIGGLLLASALSKEYGLAFCFALAACAITERRRQLGLAAVTAGVAYAMLRLGLAGGAFASYCDDMGFAFDIHTRCIGASTQVDWAQLVYNVAATALGTASPSLFTEEGMIEIYRWDLLIGLAFLLPAAVAVVAGAPYARLIAFVPIGNALLSFMVFRDRNQLIGAAAIAILTALGLARLQQTLGRATLARVVGPIALALGLAYLGREAMHTHRLTTRESASLKDQEPCESAIRDRPFGDRFVTKVKTRYGMTDPECLADN
jgi:hypothetical protein